VFRERGDTNATHAGDSTWAAPVPVRLQTPIAFQAPYCNPQPTLSAATPTPLTRETARGRRPCRCDCKPLLHFKRPIATHIEFQRPRLNSSLNFKDAIETRIEFQRPRLKPALNFKDAIETRIEFQGRDRNPTDPPIELRCRNPPRPRCSTAPASCCAACVSPCCRPRPPRARTAPSR
jgi:hypothetical protein